MNFNKSKITTLQEIEKFDGSGKKALIFWGGWDGHQPEQIAKMIQNILEELGMEVMIYDNQKCLEDAEVLKEFHLIVPVWTMGEIKEEYVNNISTAVGNGTGIAGCHGGMCDAFRNSVLWQFITGGNWVAHPGDDGVNYSVKIKECDNPIVKGINDFKMVSEQYYLHVDPSANILATTPCPTIHGYHSSNGSFEMPVMWTKYWGHGRVYYTAIGHNTDTFKIPEAEKTLKRGLIWSAIGKDIALTNGDSGKDFE